MKKLLVITGGLLKVLVLLIAFAHSPNVAAIGEDWRPVVTRLREVVIKLRENLGVTEGEVGTKEEELRKQVYELLELQRQRDADKEAQMVALRDQLTDQTASQEELDKIKAELEQLEKERQEIEDAKAQALKEHEEALKVKEAEIEELAGKKGDLTEEEEDALRKTHDEENARRAQVEEELRKEKEEADARLSQMQESLEQTRSQLEQMPKVDPGQLERLQELTQSQQAEIEKYQAASQEADSLRKEVETLRQQLEKAPGSDRLKAMIQNYQMQMQMLQQQMYMQQMNYKKLKTSRDKSSEELQAEIDSLSTELQEAESAAETGSGGLMRKVKVLEAELSKISKKSSAQLSKLSQDLEDISKEKARLEGELEAANTKLKQSDGAKEKDLKLITRQRNELMQRLALMNQNYNIKLKDLREDLELRVADAKEQFSKLERTMPDISSIEKQVAKIKTQISGTEEEMNELESALKEEQEKAANLGMQAQQQQMMAAQYGQQTMILTQQLESQRRNSGEELDNLTEEFNKKMGFLNDTMKEASKDLSSMDIEQETLKQEIDMYDLKVESLEESRQNLRKLVEDKKQELSAQKAEYKHKINEQHKQIAQWERAYQTTKTQAGTRATQLASHKKEKRKLTRKIAKLEDDVRDGETLLGKAQNELNKVQAEAQTLVAARDKNKEKMDTLATELKQWQETQEEWTQRLLTGRQETEELRGRLQEREAAMQAASAAVGEISGTLGMQMQRLVQTPPAERATALGQSRQEEARLASDAQTAITALLSRSKDNIEIASFKVGHRGDFLFKYRGSLLAVRLEKLDTEQTWQAGQMWVEDGHGQFVPLKSQQDRLNEEELKSVINNIAKRYAVGGNAVAAAGEKSSLWAQSLRTRRAIEAIAALKTGNPWTGVQMTAATTITEHGDLTFEWIKSGKTYTVRYRPQILTDIEADEAGTTWVKCPHEDIDGNEYAETQKTAYVVLNEAGKMHQDEIRDNFMQVKKRDDWPNLQNISVADPANHAELQASFWAKHLRTVNAQFALRDLLAAPMATGADHVTANTLEIEDDGNLLFQWKHVNNRISVRPGQNGTTRMTLHSLHETVDPGGGKESMYILPQNAEEEAGRANLTRTRLETVMKNNRVDGDGVPDATHLGLWAKHRMQTLVLEFAAGPNRPDGGTAHNNGWHHYTLGNAHNNNTNIIFFIPTNNTRVISWREEQEQAFQNIQDFLTADQARAIQAHNHD